MSTDWDTAGISCPQLPTKGQDQAVSIYEKVQMDPQSPVNFRVTKVTSYMCPGQHKATFHIILLR